MRYFLLSFALLVALVISLAGFRGSVGRKPPLDVFPDMDRQWKIRPQSPDTFFANGTGSQLPVQGTVARGEQFEISPATTGLVTGTTNFVESMPMEITAELVQRGRQRYSISCAPCHGPTGDGNGITRKYGMNVVANLHDRRIVSMPDGELFHVITHGRNLMGPYGPVVPVDERWATIAYLRALQLARLGTLEEIPQQARAAIAQ
ncbi:MAG TPA: cytochrome c [Methylomirabilota bacterium]|nr:cytochrome c [Methylomirabilota bacterium]